MSSLPVHMPCVKLAILWAGAWTRWAPAVGPSSSAIQGSAAQAHLTLQKEPARCLWNGATAAAGLLVSCWQGCYWSSCPPFLTESAGIIPAVGTGSEFHLSHPFQNCNPIHCELCQHARCGPDWAQPVPYASSAQEASSTPEIGQAEAAAFEITAAKSIRAFSQVFNTDRKGF